MNDNIIIKQKTSSLSSNETMFAEVIGMIQTTRQNVIRVANTALIDLYWKVGEYLSQKIASAEWGDGVVRQLAEHISRNCPDIKGFSDKNLWRMKQFYETYAEDAEKLSTLLRQISWSHNRLIMSRCKSAAERKFYLEKACAEHYSFRQLDRQIDSALYERTQVNQPKLSPLLREIAPEAERVFRDQYVMEFITGKEAKPENNLRRALLKKIKPFILELGKDFICIMETDKTDMISIKE
ncbi:MAG: PDDEXK nuclease domain-containing protein [Bacteroidales bacterium]|nr:PDDEXK nuclease domain-containing protein [Bacteroidales bacterium]